jgi:hypothetical protein
VIGGKGHDALGIGVGHDLPAAVSDFHQLIEVIQMPGFPCRRRERGNGGGYQGAHDQQPDELAVPAAGTPEAPHQQDEGRLGWNAEIGEL